MKIRLDDVKVVLFGGWFDFVKLRRMLEDDDIFLFISRFDVVKLKLVVEDWIFFIVNWLNNVELMLIFVVLVIVLFGVIFGSKVVEFWFVDVKVIVFEIMIKVDIFDNFEGGVLDVEGVGVIVIIFCVCFRILRRIMFFWVLDKICYFIIGIFISVLMVLFWVVVLSFEKFIFVSFNVLYVMF